jgi:Ca2+-transporting ATPase
LAEVNAVKGYHLLPGRLRIAAEGLRRNPEYARYLAWRLRQVEGIREVSANPLTGRALILFSPAILGLAAIQRELGRCRDDYVKARAAALAAAAVPAAGRAGREVAAAAHSEAPVAEARQPATLPLLYTAATGGVLAAILAKRLLVGRSPLAASPRVFNLAAITALVSGYPILRDGFDQLTRKKKLNADLLIFVATIILLAMRESIAGLSVLWIVHLSNLYRHVMQAHTRKAIKRMLLEEYGHAARLTDGRQERVPLRSLAAGDVIVVGREAFVPVSGTVADGEAVIGGTACGGTATSIVGKGERVAAGSFVHSGQLSIRVEEVCAAVLDAGIDRFVAKADKKIRPLVRTSDYYADKLVPWSIGVAALTFVVTRDPARSLAVLLAGTPVAIALSRHAALGSALGVALRDGIYVKDARHFEAVSQADAVLFDNAGTLPAAVPKVTEVAVIEKAYTAEEVVGLAASAVAAARHPLAAMLINYARRQKVEILPVEKRTVFDCGVAAVVNGDTVAVGDELFMAQEKVYTKRANSRVRRMHHLGLAVVFVGVNGKVAGVIGYTEEVTAESVEAVGQLRTLGISRIGLVKSDPRVSAQTVKDSLGITEQWGATLPDDKQAIVKRLHRDKHRVIMVGDGINDGQALAAADVGIALGCGGSRASARAADIIVKGDDPRKIANLVHLSKYTGEVIRQNIALSTGLSIAGVALAAGRLLSPVAAMLLLNVSTAAVLLNSARVLKHRAAASRPALDLQRFSSGDIYPGPEGAADMAMPASGRQVKADALLALPPANACELLGTSAQAGLTVDQVSRRRAQHGPNLLAKGVKPGFWQLFRSQFRDFMVQVLLGAAGLSFALGRSKDALLTLAVVVGNAVLGVIQEQKAEKSLDALQSMAAPQARAIRDGRPQKVAAQELVPGDVIILEAGDQVPADARLLTTWRFEVEEASLTGETVAASKEAMFTAHGELPLGDRKNMVYMGTSVTRGRATAVVVATGMATEMGKLARLIQDGDEHVTPLQRRLEELGKFLVCGCLAVSGLVFLIGLLRGQPALYMLQTGASLAVAAIPEGLTAIIIIALAMGVQRMSKRNIIVRKLSSLETLGCATVICSDKTGTLTKNEMTVREVYTYGRVWKVGGEGYSPAGDFQCDNRIADPRTDAALWQTLLTGALCNNSRLVHDRQPSGEKIVSLEEHRATGWRVDGDPTEGALLVAAAKAGLRRQELDTAHIRLFENPFEAERRMMSVFYANHGSKHLYSKGSPDKILSACKYLIKDGQVSELDDKAREEILAANDRMAGEALRVLAFAYRQLDESESGGDQDDCERNLVFCGLIGMIDPPRPEVPAAIAKCRKAGVKVVMITGDHPSTALAVAREIRLLSSPDQLMTGAGLDALSDRQLAEVVDKVAVYARTSPHQKLRIIKALKAKGYIVAMTGDGVNDAPAVKAADIGIAMGLMGTDVTKEAASLTLTDDNFATIVKAMEEGRSIYANIRKAIRYLVATNIGEVILMLLAVALGLPLPLIPLQLLWINLVGDGLPAVALVNDPPARNIMHHSPRSADDSVFAGDLGKKILSRGLAIGLTSLALYAWTLKKSGNLLWARTMTLVQLAISQFIHIFDCRWEKQSGKVGLFSNPWLVGSVIISMAMIAGIVYIPGLRPIFGTTALTPGNWLFAAGVAVISALLDFGLARILKRIDVKLPVPGNSLVPVR